MPRDQETSIGHDQSSDDPLFRQPGDQSLHGDPLRDPLDDDTDTDADRADTPIGDAIPTGRHANGADPDADDAPSDTPGEWVAGNRGPGYVSGRDGSVVPSQPGQPPLESTGDSADPLTADATSDTDRPAADPDRADPDSFSADPDTVSAGTDPVTGDPLTGDPATNGSRVTADPNAPAGSGTSTGLGTSADPDAPTDPDAPAVSDASVSGTPADPDAPAATGATSDLRTTSDPQVAPDSAFTRGSGTPTDPNAPAGSTATTTPATAATPATGTAATAPGTTPATPVPGAPGTGSTTGVQAASAALVTHSSELHDDWARIQSSFVDDPRGSVSQAADLVSQVTTSLVNALQERERTLRGAWDSSGADTENLRNALRDYRAFFEMLTKV